MTGLIKTLLIISLLYFISGCQSSHNLELITLPVETSFELNKKEKVPHFNEIQPNITPSIDTSPIVPSPEEIENSNESGNQPQVDESLSNNENTSEVNPVQPKPDTGVFSESMEQQIIELVNETRESLGIDSLSMSQPLRVTARAKSKDMYEYQYFDHNGHLTFSKLLEEQQIIVHISGENIYRSQSPLTSAQVIFDAWKESPTHYANMINDQFHHIGVGIYVIDEGGIRTYYVTQHLTD